MPLELARTEIAGSKDDIEQALGTNVRFFAYPGGVFNRAVSRVVQEAGFEAACSVLGPALNDRSTLHWLYRDLLTESLTSLGDRYRLNAIARRILSFRVRRRLSQALTA